MTQQEFFRSVKHVFGYEATERVKRYMRSRDYLQGKANSTSAAAALILMGCTATEQDLQTFGKQILEVEQRSETLLKVVDYILKDEMNAVTIGRMIFDRANATVVFELVDGTDFTFHLNVPVQPTWTEKPAIELDQSQLVSLALDLQGDFIEKGARVTEN